MLTDLAGTTAGTMGKASPMVSVRAWVSVIVFLVSWGALWCSHPPQQALLPATSPYTSRVRLAIRFQYRYCSPVANWTFLTNHARVLMCIAGDPGIRLRDIAAELSITERHAYGIVVDLTEAGYLVKEKDGRRNRYRVRAHLPLPESTARKRTVGELLALLSDTDSRSPTRRPRTRR